MGDYKVPPELNTYLQGLAARIVALENVPSSLARSFASGPLGVDSTSSTTYTTLVNPGPDAVTIPLLNKGLLVVEYQATWTETVAGAASAALFLNGNQVVIAQHVGVTGPNGTTAAIGGTPSFAVPLSSWAGGLVSCAASSPGYNGDVGTGQIIGLNGPPVSGGACYIFANPGTYTVSVQFKVSSGTVAVSNRRLRVDSLLLAS